jgi:putative heme-binding domain-containing protein
MMNRPVPLILGTVLVSRILAAGSTSSASEPDPEVAALRVLPGFRIGRFADERLGVVKPTQVRFDGDGRMWVATTTSYPQLRPGEEPRDKIVVLEDRDRDGVADTSHVFADGLHIPLGLELGNGGVYVGAADELLFLRDTDGDGKADERRVIFSGFGTGDTHQTLNSFAWGPAGELMMSQGLHAFSRIETRHGNVTLHQAGIWRFWPANGRLEPFWDGAMGAHNPYGTAFDASGRPLVFAGNGHGIYDLAPALQPTDHFLLHPPVWSEGRKFGGVDVSDNSHWPESQRGEFIAGGYLQNTVERFRISADGSSVRPVRLPPLVESTNTAFRVVDLRFGPDGALYLCDWFNPVIGHYQTSFRHPDRDKTHGRIWRVSAEGSTPLRPPALESAEVKLLLQELLSPERWNRQQAARVLRGRPAEIVLPALDVWIGTADSETVRDDRMGAAVEIRTAFNRTETGTLDRLARSGVSLHRIRAARHTARGNEPVTASLPRLARLAADPDPQVRLEAVVACSWIQDGRAIEAAAIAADRPMDTALRYAFIQCVHALKPWWRPLQAEGRLTFQGSEPRQLAFAAADRTQETVQLAADRLRRIAEVALDDDVQWSLVETLLAGGDARSQTVLLQPRSFTVGITYHPDRHAAALLRLAENPAPEGLALEPLRSAARALLESKSPPVQAAAARWVGRWRIPGQEGFLETMADDTGVPTTVRAGAVWAVGTMGGTAQQARLRRIAMEGSDELLVAVVEAMARIDLAEAVALTTERLSKPVDEAMVLGLSRELLRHGSGAVLLADGFRTRITHPTAAQAIQGFLARSGRTEPALVRALGNRGAGLDNPLALLTEGPDREAFLREARIEGDPDRGRRIFQGAERGCASCHPIGGGTQGLGPDLSALGTAQNPGFILGAILQPQKEVKEGFTAWTVGLKDGTSRQGRLIHESPELVVLFDAAERREVRIRRSEIDELRSVGSIMPEGLADGLTREELRDLIAFLSRLGRRD